MVDSLSNILPINIVGTISGTTASGTPTAIFSRAAVQNVVIVTEDPIPVELIGDIDSDPLVAATGIFTESLTVSGIPVLTTAHNVPGGANEQVQFNDSGAFGGDAGFTYSGIGVGVGIDGELTANSGTFGEGITVGTSSTHIFPNEIRVRDAIIAGNLTVSGSLVTGGGGGISNVVEDTTPELGGNLDALGNDIIGVGTVTGTTILAVTGTITAGLTVGDGSTHLFPTDVRSDTIRATGGGSDSASAPSIVVDGIGGETNTGLFRVGSNTLGLSAGGTEKLRLNTGAGNVEVLGGGLAVAAGTLFSSFIKSGFAEITLGTNFLTVGAKVDLAQVDVWQMGERFTALSDKSIILAQPQTALATSIPGYSFSGDLNTGIQSPEADVVGFTAGGTNVLLASGIGVGIAGLLFAGSGEFSTGLTVSGIPVNIGAGGGGGISAVVEDTTPELGGTLDALGEDIIGVGTVTGTTILAVTGTITAGLTIGTGSTELYPEGIRVGDGSLGSPSVAFASAPNTGMFLSATSLFLGRLGLAGLQIGGGGNVVALERFDIAANKFMFMNTGSSIIGQSGWTVGAGTTGFLFDSASDFIMVKPKATDVWSFRDFGTGEGVIQAELDTCIIINGDGQANRPAYSFRSAQTTGMFLASEGANSSIGFRALDSTPANQDVVVISGGVGMGVIGKITTGSGIFTDVALIPDGTVAAPGLAFTSAQNTGLRATGSNMSLINQGVSKISLSTGAITFSDNTLGIDGGAAGPSYAFTNSTQTGMYRAAADEIGFSTGNSNALTLAVGAATFQRRVRAIDGNLGNPGFAFTDDIDTGMRRMSDDVVAIVAGGANGGRLVVSGTGQIGAGLIGNFFAGSGDFSTGLTVSGIPVDITGGGGGGSSTTAETLDKDFTAGQTISVGAVVALGSAGNVFPADASSVDTIEAIGFATTSGTPAGSVTVRHQGEVTGLSGLTTGEPLFLSATQSGAVTITPPSATGSFILQVGHATSTSTAYVNVNSATATENTSDTLPVTTLNALSGTVTVTGLGSINTITTGQEITFSGSAVESTPVFIPFPGSGIDGTGDGSENLTWIYDYNIEVKQATVKTTSGTLSYSLLLDGVLVEGLDNQTVTTTQAVDFATSAGTYTAGDEITLAISGALNAENFRFGLKAERT